MNLYSALISGNAFRQKGSDTWHTADEPLQFTAAQVIAFNWETQEASLTNNDFWVKYTQFAQANPGAITQDNAKLLAQQLGLGDPPQQIIIPVQDEGGIIIAPGP